MPIFLHRTLVLRKPFFSMSYQKFTLQQIRRLLICKPMNCAVT